jgi:hypothetical protein
MLIVVGILFLLSALVIPNYVANRPLRAPKNACINNLRIIDAAKGQWATEQHKVITDTPTGSDIQPYMCGPSGEMPVCPNDPKNSFDTSYSPNNVGTKPVCRILPTNHILP